MEPSTYHLTSTNRAAYDLPEPKVEEGQVIIWAFLALAKFTTLIDPFDLVQSDISEDENSHDYYDIALSHAFELLMDAFSDGWPNLSVEQSRTTIPMFSQTLITGNEARDIPAGPREMYLLDRLGEFHKMALRMLDTNRAGALAQDALTRQVVDTLNPDVFEPAVSFFLDEHRTLLALTVVADRNAALNHLVGVHTQRILAGITNFILTTSESAPDPHGAIAKETHHECVQVIEELLEDHIHEALRRLSAKLVVPESPMQRRKHVEAFLMTIGEFFSYATPLFEKSDIMPDEAEPELATPTGDEWEEFEVPESDLEDVLTGPETVSVGEVSRPVGPEYSTVECGIYGQADDDSVRLNVCGHMFCTDCLTQQLQARGNFRYRCAMCRRYIVDDA